MKVKRWFVGMLAVLLCMAGMVLPQASGAFGDAPRITKEEAKTLLGKPGVVFLDARTSSVWSKAETKIKGAERVDPGNVGAWAKDRPRDAKLIVY